MVNITLATYTKLAAQPNIVGCKMSHGVFSHHLQVALDPAIDHDTFRVYSGFGQQSAPLACFGGAGVSFFLPLPKMNNRVEFIKKKKKKKKKFA